MGDLADEAHDAWMIEEYERSFLALIDPHDPALIEWARHGKWVTRDGKKLAVREMSTTHLRNAIRFLAHGPSILAKQLPRVADVWIARMQRELGNRALLLKGTCDQCQRKLSYGRVKAQVTSTGDVFVQCAVCVKQELTSGPTSR